MGKMEWPGFDARWDLVMVSVQVESWMTGLRRERLFWLAVVVRSEDSNKEQCDDGIAREMGAVRGH